MTDDSPALPFSDHDRNHAAREAARTGHLKALRMLQHHGADPAAFNGWDNSALHYAAAESHLPIMRALLEQGVPVDHRNRAGDETPLHEAVIQGKTEAVRMLLERGANPLVYKGSKTAFELAQENLAVQRVLLSHWQASGHRMPPPGMTAASWRGYTGDLEGLPLRALLDDIKQRRCNTLHWAIIQGHPSVVEKLWLHIGGGARNQACADGWTPLDLAVRFDRAAIAQQLIAMGTQPTRETLKLALEDGSLATLETVVAAMPANQHQYTLRLSGDYPLVRERRRDLLITLMDKQWMESWDALEAAVETGWRALFPFLMEQGVSLTAIFEAGIDARNEAALQWAVDQGLSPIQQTPDEESPYIMAAENGWTAMAKRFWHPEAVHPKDFHSPLEHAVNAGWTEKVLELSQGNPDQRSQALYLAIRGNQTPIVDAMLDAGATVYAAHCAKLLAAPVQWNNPPLLDRLLDAGIGHPACFSEVLTEAVEEGHQTMVDVLLERGASPDGVADEYSTPLIEALKGTRTELLERLLEAGADPNRADSRGRTPLSEALGKSQFRHAGMLLKHGADPNLAFNTNLDRLSRPLAVALESMRDEAIVPFLLAHGADPLATLHDGRTILTTTLEDNPDDLAILLSQGIAADLQMDGEPLVHRLLSLPAEYREAPLQALLVQTGALAVRNQTGVSLRERLLNFSDPALASLVWAHHPQRSNLVGLAEDIANGPVGAINQQLDKAGLSTESRLPDGETLLMKAARHGRLATAAALLDAGADVTPTNSRGETAAHIALRHGHPETAGLLLSKETLHQTDERGRSVYHLLVAYGTPELVRRAAGLSQQTVPEDNSGQSALALAARLNGPAAVAILESDPAGTEEVPWLAELYQQGELTNLLQTRADELTPAFGHDPRIGLLLAAIHRHDHDRVSNLLEDEPDLQTRYAGTDVLDYAARSRNAQAWEQLRDAGVHLQSRFLRDGTSDIQTLLYAYQKGGLTLVTRLLEALDPEERADYLLERAGALSEHLTEAALAGILRQVDLNATEHRYFLPLHQAIAREDHPRLIRAMLLAGADPELEDRQGMSATIKAQKALENDLDWPFRRALIHLIGQTPESIEDTTVRQILSGQEIEHIDPSTINRRDPTTGLAALEASVFTEEPHRIAQLLDHGAEITSTALHLIAGSGNVALLEAVNRHISDINLRDGLGNTPLLTAVRSGHVAMTHALLRLGARPDDFNQDHVSPLHEATWDNAPLLVALLLSHEADPEGVSDRRRPSALYNAVANADPLTVNRLIDAGADPDRGWVDASLLDWAYRYANPAVLAQVRALLPEPEEALELRLDAALEQRREWVVKGLLEEGVRL